MRNVMLSRVSKLLVITVLFTLLFCFGAVDKAGADTALTLKVTANGTGGYSFSVTGDDAADLAWIHIQRKADGGDSEVVTGKRYPYSETLKGKWPIEDTDISFDSSYEYVAVAYNTDEDGQIIRDSLLFSKSVTVKGVKAKTPSFTDVVVTGTTKLKLYWDKVSGAEGYKIYQKDGSNYVLVKTVKGGSKKSAVISGLTKNKKATFKIASFSGKKKSAKSSAISDKPRDNAYVKYPSTKLADYKSGKLSVNVKKISYNSDGNIVCKVILVNRDSKRVSTFGKITFKIYHDGDLIAKQIFKEKKVNLAKNKIKTMTFTLSKGTKKKNVNLRHGEVDYDIPYSYRVISN